MKVDVTNLQQLFAKQVWYEIPIYQRRYVWEEEEQWEPLWVDVQHTAERYIEEREKGADMHQFPGHFLGAVVIQQKLNQTARLESREVVDGQQRFTTLQLLLDAIQEVYEHHGENDAAKRLADLVTNSPVYRGDNPDLDFKVWPTEVDQPAFRHAMRNELASDEYEESQIVRAHDFFKSKVGDWLNEREGERKARVEALELTVANYLQLAVIDLTLNDDPHVIFETLNARGTPLLASELIKNMILREANLSHIPTAEAATLWRYDVDWWKRDVRQGRLVHPRVDVFLNYWLVMRTRSEVVAKDVFPTFRRHYEQQKPTQSIADLAREISIAANAYQALEDHTQPWMRKFLYRRDVMQVGVLTPVLLWLLTSQAPQWQLDKSVKAIESYLIRRMVCGMTTKDYNRLFIGLLGALEQAGSAQCGDALVQYLKGQDAFTRHWPDDRQFQEALLTKPLYWQLTRGRLRLVLEGIEEELRTNFAESREVSGRLTIEHIMPQAWRDHWPLPNNTIDRTAAEIRRNGMVHFIGNLTLVNRPLNSRLSNVPWEQKKADLSNHSILFLNKTLLENAPAVWDEAAIEQRGRQLAQAAIRVWPHADKF